MAGAGRAMRVLEFDPLRAPVFAKNHSSPLPLTLLMETVLQSGMCELLLDTTDHEALCGHMARNLDGRITWLGPLPHSGELCRHHTHNTTRLDIVGSRVWSAETHTQAESLPTLQCAWKTGFFTRERLEGMAGVPDVEDEQHLVDSGDVLIELSTSRWTDTHFPFDIPVMLSRVIAMSPRGGRHGRGVAVAETDIDPRHWIFKCHFFQDPVQPGSLGIEGMLQLATLHAGKGGDVPDPSAFELPPFTWRYRGQVRPKHGKTTTIVHRVTPPDAPTVLYDGSLYVDGMRIYDVRNLPLLWPLHKALCGVRDSL